jgi:secreted PhoX family phosphatase
MANQDNFRNRAAACEAHDDLPRSPERGETIDEVMLRRFSRRDVMRGTFGVTAAAALFGPAAFGASSARTEITPDRFDFAEVAAGNDKGHHLAEGYRAQVLLRWGDPLFPDSPPFNPSAQSAAAQLKQFGYNNDYIAFFPLDESGNRGLLCVNHEYTNEELMFPGIEERQDTSGFEKMTAELVEIEMAAHGVSIVEIARDGPDWRVVLDSRYNRRITPGTKMMADGPAAGDRRLKTSADRSGKTIIGTLNNCAGGKTPWNTYLTAEENFHAYFWSNECTPGGARPKGLGGVQAASYRRYGIPSLWQAWGKFVDRFNVDKEPNEPNRFGWIVEIDLSIPSLCR